MKVEQNTARLKYLLALYKMTVDELLVLIGEGLRKPLTREDILDKEIEINHLKRIDKVFKKGLHYYLDPKSPEVKKEASIFFRKQTFGADLNIGARKIVNQFEELKISLSAISKLAELNIERTLPVFTIHRDPKAVADQVRKDLYPEFNSVPKEFLRAFIGKLAENNILVFEFVETWNKKEKANIDGFFLQPNVIVLKRQQQAFRREIFSLAHELGHYLINEEEIEELDLADLASHKISKVERWCNDFAYYFLAGDADRVLQGLGRADGTNDYYFDMIDSLSKQTHLSKLALFTRMLFENKISKNNYHLVKTDLEKQYRDRQEEEKRKREEEKAGGLKQRGAAPKPINSPLLVSTIQAAFYEGIINEYDVCKTLNISPDKLGAYLQ